MVLEFDHATHRYRLDGQPVPGVTSVLNSVNDEFRFVDPAVLEAAREYGSHVHLAVDLFNKGVLDWDSLDPALVKPVTGWRRFLEDTGTVITASELRVHHRKLKVAGTLDATGLTPARRKGRAEVGTLIDIKSGAVPFTVGPQTAIYEACRRDMGMPAFRRRMCVQLHDVEPFYTLHELKNPADLSVFISALNIQRYKGRLYAR